MFVQYEFKHGPYAFELDNNIIYTYINFASIFFLGFFDAHIFSMGVCVCVLMILLAFVFINTTDKC